MHSPDTEILRFDCAASVMVGLTLWTHVAALLGLD